jgi:SAM-dependent methyltransferase
MDMEIGKTVRVAARKILGPRLMIILRRRIRILRFAGVYRRHLRLKRGLEIGGPSPMLAHNGEFPIYDVLESLDNCLYSSATIWAGEVHQGNTFLYDPGKAPGVQIISDATDLRTIQDSSYECILACHCLEHVANPLRALAEWKRVLKDDGLLLLILPHKDATFDWRRSATPLAHMIEDYEKAVGEDDLTHLPEILDLHDLTRDEAAGTKEQFRQRCLRNSVARAMHHHVFDTMTALAVVNQAGFKILRVDSLQPCNIVILAGRANQTFDNRHFLERGSKHWTRSPFPSDHEPTNS